MAVHWCSREKNPEDALWGIENHLKKTRWRQLGWGGQTNFPSALFLSPRNVPPSSHHHLVMRNLSKQKTRLFKYWRLFSETEFNNLTTNLRDFNAVSSMFPMFERAQHEKKHRIVPSVHQAGREVPSEMRRLQTGRRLQQVLGAEGWWQRQREITFLRKKIRWPFFKREKSR